MIAGLEKALRQRVRGEVRFDSGHRALYATTGSNYRMPPIGVVFPRDAADVVETLAVCRAHGAPVLPRGGGTSLAGQSVNTAVVFDLSKHMNGIVELDAALKRARVHPGCVLDDLRSAAEVHHLTFAPDPSTHAYCTLGGMIGNNSCGVHSVMGGKTVDNIVALEVVTYDGVRMHVGATSEPELAATIAAGGRRGEIYSGLKSLSDRYADRIRSGFPKLPRRVSGYNLDELLPERGFHVARALVGSEGTCVTVLEATTRLVPSPPCRVLLVLGYPDVYTAADHVPQVLDAKPIGLEGIDDRLVDDMERKGLHVANTTLLPEGGGWLLVEFGGDTVVQAEDAAHKLMARLRNTAGAPAMVLLTEPAEQHQLWIVRESGLGATANVPGQPLTWEGWEDAAVPPERLGAYLREFRALLDRYGYGCDLYGHFGGGCVHTRIDFDFRSAAGVAKYRSFVETAADLVVRYGGSLSGEHGDGQARGELLPKMFGPELIDAFREFKRIWDPEGKMNPGKKIDANPLDQNLRLGAAYNSWSPATHFAFAQDNREFSRTALRCVGVGACRKTGEGTMCPSYMATREEMHSTRGRSRLLFEMLQGDVVTGRWKDEHVKEALDLCLACKACKHECPVNVDMATYKAEFLSHYYEGRLRPRHAYAFGLINVWARLASVAPSLANLVSQSPLSSDLAKTLAGLAPERRIPPFAPETFRRRFARRTDAGGAAPRSGEPVLLWPDTFTNYFHPGVADAAVDVLEHTGCRVSIPAATLCCGRPLYDYGFLDRAKARLRHIMTSLQSDIRAGTPIVVLEPSCATVFRDELLQLFPDDDDARRLSAQTFLLSEFLAARGDRLGHSSIGRRAIAHAHCHHKAMMNTGDEVRVLQQVGFDAELLDSGCCGMAGAFGFEPDHYAVSIACGERVLLPAVRAADRDTLIIADGFSCREQIAQATGRRAIHLAEALRLAIEPRPEANP